MKEDFPAKLGELPTIVQGFILAYMYNMYIHLDMYILYIYLNEYILTICLYSVHKAQKDGLISSAPGYAGLLGQLSSFRSALTSVATYGHIPVPLVYTQVGICPNT